MSVCLYVCVIYLSTFLLRCLKFTFVKFWRVDDSSFQSFEARRWRFRRCRAPTFELGGAPKSLISAFGTLKESDGRAWQKRHDESAQIIG